MRKKITLAVFLLILVGLAQASSMHEGKPIKAEVKKITAQGKEVTLQLELLENPGAPVVNKGKPVAKGDLVTVTCQRPATQFTVGQRLQVKWMHYSAMGPNGPVSGLSWKLP